MILSKMLPHRNVLFSKTFLLNIGFSKGDSLVLCCTYTCINFLYDRVESSTQNHYYPKLYVGGRAEFKMKQKITNVFENTYYVLCKDFITYGYYEWFEWRVHLTWHNYRYKFLLRSKLRNQIKTLRTKESNWDILQLLIFSSVHKFSRKMIITK